MQTAVELILASASSRRQDLLDQLGLHYDVYVSNVDESPDKNECPKEYVQRIACKKADAVWQFMPGKIPVLAADTIIAIDDNIVGKPENQMLAQNILKKLSGRDHYVYTAICLRTQQRKYESKSTTKVRFRNLDIDEIKNYSATEESYGKAGAYAIQGQAAKFIEYISGSYTGAIGLPLVELQALFKQANIYIR